MNFHNTLIWLFIYLHIYLRNLAESTGNSPTSSLSSDGSNLSTDQQLNHSTNNVAGSTVDSSGFGIGWNSDILSSLSNLLGSTQSGTPTGPNLRVETSEQDDEDVFIIESSDVSSPETSSNDQSISLGSGTNSSLPSQGSNKISVYNDSSLLSMIKNLSTLQLIDFIDSLANKLTNIDPKYDFVKHLSNFIAKAEITTHPILINLTELHSSGDYEWNSIGDKVVYTPKQGYGFKIVMQNTTVLWHTNEIKDYATKIECDNKSHTVTIHKSDGNTEEIKFTPEQETSRDLTTPDSKAPVIEHTTVLNINKLANCKEYKWIFSNGVVTCIANEKYGFRIVRQDSNIIWHTINRNNCSNKVECNYQKRKVTIHMLDGTKFEKHFEQEPDANTLITINIQDTSSTLYYTYERSGDYAFYLPNWPYRVKKVVNDGVILWWYRDNMHPHSIKVTDKKHGKRSLVLYFMSDTIEFIDPNDNRQVKKEGTSATTPESDGAGQSGGDPTTPQVILLKANPSDATKFLELDSNEYNSSTSEGVVTYNIADGVNCAQLIYDDDLVWEYDSSQDAGKYPKSVDYYSISETLVINFDDFYIVCEEEDGAWICNINDKSGVKLFVADPNDITKNVEPDSSKLTLIQDGDVNSYEISEDTNCTLFKYNGATLWQHDPIQRGGKYPKSVDHNTKTHTLVLRFEGLDLTFQNTTDGWIFTESGPLAVKFFVVDPNDNTKAVQLASNQFTLTTRGNMASYKIANGVNCIQLMFGDVLLWEYNPNHRDGLYPRSLYHDPTYKVLVLKFADLYLTFENTNEGWIFTESGPLAIKFHVVDPTDATKTVEVAKNQLTVFEIGEITTFIIGRGVNPISLTYGSVLLWQYDPNQRGGKHPKSLDYNKSTDTLALKFDGLDMSFAQTNQGQWVFTESGPLAAKLYVVDPNDNTKTVELASSQFTITTSGDITTFNIADGVNSIGLTYGPDLLWQHDANRHGGKCPKSLDYNKTTGILVLKFEGLNLTFSKNDQGRWDINQTDTSSTGTATQTADHTGSAASEPVEGASTTASDQIGVESTFGTDDKSEPVTEPTTVPDSTPEITTPPSTDSTIAVPEEQQAPESTLPVQEQQEQEQKKELQLDSSSSDKESESSIIVLD